ncbi:DNA primase regulatory subunit PriL [Metallosphaera tengchongensis]|uniref:DNA primase regulatory subunit PriL n=1 Tax=Metallosphaera tengchongensis TaxID=1532350 RepID=A0A6N0NVW1_9CREN|nr:DNA primase regulatory subunit PriL [Metallosphaera tengchongensis]QKQ99507.1 DNA primase regulatory subunit PriL [Metallosphaera tengchongensis]
MALVDSSKYPFLRPIEEVLRKEGAPDLFTLLSTEGKAIREAKGRIVNILKGGEVRRYSEYMSPQLVFYSLILILGVLNDNRITERVLRTESRYFRREMEKESDDVLQEIAKWSGYTLKISPLRFHMGKKPLTAKYSIHFLEYLRVAKGHHEDSLSLSSNILHKGYVHLNKARLLLLMELALYKKLRDLVKPIPLDKIPESLIDIISIRGGKTPPCVKALMEKRDRNKEEALVLATYMANTGASLDSISLVLEKGGVENLDSALKGIFKEKMVIYSCEKMKELNLCVANCGTKSPLQFYFGNVDITR